MIPMLLFLNEESNEAQLGKIKGVIHHFKASMLELQACCQDTTPRPSDSECARYGVKIASSIQAPERSKGSDKR